MVFRPRSPSGGLPPESDIKSSDSLESLVDLIADRVRQTLIAQGVPLPTHPAGKSHTPSYGNGSQSSGQSYKKTFSTEKIVSLGASRVGQSADTPIRSAPEVNTGDLPRAIDHTLLKPEATEEEIRRVCKEARDYHFATVCVNSTHVELAAQLLKGSDVKAIAVVGFPLGAAATATKAFEARESIQKGAQEIDMVINIGALKGRDYDFVFEDIKKVVESSAPYPVKVILETSNLSDEEKIAGCVLSKAAGAAFVKTSTGFGSGGATAEDVELMRRIVGSEMGVKASGGIRSYEDAQTMIKAGANRIGASASIAIVTKKSSSSGSSGSDSGKKSYKRGGY